MPYSSQKNELKSRIVLTTKNGGYSKSHESFLKGYPIQGQFLFVFMDCVMRIVSRHIDLT